MSATRILAAVFCLGLLACAPSALAGQPAAGDEELDTIIRTDKIPVPPTKIIKEDYLYVIGKKGAEIKVPSYAVREVMRADRDANYSAAIEKRDEGRYTLAALYFQKALENMGAQSWAVEYCNYGIADALYQSGYFKGYKGRSGTEYAPPSVYYQKVLTANPKSRFLPDVMVKLPVCLAEEGKLADAEAKLREAEAKIKAYRAEGIQIHGGFGELADKANAQLAIADARLAERKAAGGSMPWEDVKEKWMSARFKCAKFPEPYADATDGVMRALVTMKKFNDAKAEAEKIIEKYKKEGDANQLPLLPGAYTVLGKANLAQAVELEGRGATIQARDAYAEARWAFLHVIGQFFDNDDYVVQAHYFAGICCDKLRELESDAGDKAIRHWKLIVQNFPKSEFKERAQKELDRVGVPKAAAPEPKKAEAAPPTPPAAAPAEPKKAETKKAEPKKK